MHCIIDVRTTVQVRSLDLQTGFLDKQQQKIQIQEKHQPEGESVRTDYDGNGKRQCKLLYASKSSTHNWGLCLSSICSQHRAVSCHYTTDVGFRQETASYDLQQ